MLGAVLALGLLDQQVITPLIAALAAGLGASVPEVGAALSGYAIAASLAALVAGPLSDLQGRRRYLLLAGVLLLFAAAAVALFPSYRLFFAARIAAGAAGGTISALAAAWVADLVPYARRGRVMALLMGGALGIATLGQVAAAFAAGALGYRVVYLGLGAFAGATILMLAALPERRAREPGEIASRGCRAGSDEPGKRQLGSRLLAHRDFLRRPPHRNAAFAAFFMSGSLVGVTAYASGWLQETRGFPLERVGLLYGAFGAAILIVQPLAGPLADRFGKRRFALAASLVVIALTLLLPGLPDPLLVAALIAFGCFAVARITAFTALRSELVVPERRAAFLAFSNTFSQLGIAAAAALGGVFYPFGFEAVCWAMAAFGAIAAILIASLPEPGASP